MPTVLPQAQYRQVWDQVHELFHYPNLRDSQFQSPYPCKTFQASIWDERQEALVNQIFCDLFPGQLYALDWQHDCFCYDPREKISTGIDDWWYDQERDVRVYFPSYYPDGDYHAFVFQDFRQGLFGHPWKQEIYVVGEAIIAAFEANAEALGLRFAP